MAGYSIASTGKLHRLKSFSVNAGFRLEANLFYGRLLALARSVSPGNGTNAAHGEGRPPRRPPRRCAMIFVFSWQSLIDNRRTIPLENLTAVVTPLSLGILVVHFATFYASLLFTSTTDGEHTSLAYRYGITAAPRGGGCVLGQSVLSSESPLSN